MISGGGTTTDVNADRAILSGSTMLKSPSTHIQETSDKKQNAIEDKKEDVDVDDQPTRPLDEQFVYSRLP